MRTRLAFILFGLALGLVATASASDVACNLLLGDNRFPILSHVARYVNEFRLGQLSLDKKPTPDKMIALYNDGAEYRQASENLFRADGDSAWGNPEINSRFYLRGKGRLTSEVLSLMRTSSLRDAMKSLHLYKIQLDIPEAGVIELIPLENKNPLQKNGMMVVRSEKARSEMMQQGESQTLARQAYEGSKHEPDLVNWIEKLFGDSAAAKLDELGIANLKLVLKAEPLRKYQVELVKGLGYELDLSTSNYWAKQKPIDATRVSATKKIITALHMLKRLGYVVTDVGVVPAKAYRESSGTQALPSAKTIETMNGMDFSPQLVQAVHTLETFLGYKYNAPLGEWLPSKAR